jgi:hypothetical protein
MKRKRFLALGLALLYLVGCAPVPAEDAGSIALTFPQSVAVFDGRRQGDTAEGFCTAEDWKFEGTAVGGRLTDGRGESLPCAVDLGGRAYPGRYTGEWEDRSPHGQGFFLADSGAVFTGTFVRGAADAGQAGDLPLTLAWDGRDYAGEYTGALSGGVPQGEGVFTGESAAGQTLAWEGGWSAGRPAGAGTLRADRLVTVMEDTECAGVYDGAGADGLPQGQGTFASVDSGGTPFTYTGAWEGGLMQGQGTLTFRGENFYTRAGDFTAGRFTPSFLQALATLGTADPIFTLTGEQISFLEQYPALWEAESHQNYQDSDYKPLLNRKLTLDSVVADPELLAESAWMSLSSLRVIRADTVTAFPGAPEMTRITAANGTYTAVVRLIVPERIDGLRRGQRIHAYAVPLAMSEYTTVLGERQSVLVLLAGDVYIGL